MNNTIRTNRTLVPLAGRDQRLGEHPTIGKKGLALLQSGGPVAVVGLGTLGSRTAVELGALGVPLLLVDHGAVELANVGWQRYTPHDVGQRKVDALEQYLQIQRPGISIRKHHGVVKTLAAGILHHCRTVLGCLDNMTTRTWLAQRCAALGKPYLDLALDGSGRTLYGRVSGMAPYQGTGCLACGWDHDNWDEVNREKGSQGCADLLRQQESITPPTLALPGLVQMLVGFGILQTIRLLLGHEVERVLGKEWRLNLNAGRLSEGVLTQDPKCRLNHDKWDIRKLKQNVAEMTVGQLSRRATTEFESELVLSVPDSELVLRAACMVCKTVESSKQLRAGLAGCSRCGGLLVPLNESIRSEFSWDDLQDIQGKTWQELGLPEAGAVQAKVKEAIVTFVFADSGSSTS